MDTRERQTASTPQSGGRRLVNSADLQQQSLDAAFNLLAARREIIQYVDERGRPQRPGIEVLGIGLENIRRELCRRGPHYREQLTACRSKAEGLRYCEAVDSKSAADGQRMIDLYDYEYLDPEGQEYVASRQWGQHQLCVAPVQTKINDRRTVIVEGPSIEGERSVLEVTEHRVLAAAWEYWNFVSTTSIAVPDVVSGHPLARLADRQHEVAQMMADDLTDETIAVRLDVSIRTVRADLASLMRLLHARSRFGAGLRLGQLGFEHLADRDQEYV